MSEMGCSKSNMVGNIIRTARKHRRWSQADLARKSNICPSAISHFENGKRSPSIWNLSKLAKGLNVTTDFLLGLEVRRKSIDIELATKNVICPYCKKDIEIIVDIVYPQ